MKNSIRFLSLFFLLSGCSWFEKEQPTVDGDGAVIRMAPLWKQNITDKASLAEGMRYSISKNGYTLIIRDFNGKDEFVWLEAKTGNSKWIWNEGEQTTFDIKTGLSLINESSITVSDNEIFQLDLETGLANFHFLRESGEGSFQRIAELDHIIYINRTFSTRDDGKLTDFVYKLNTSTRVLERLLEPNFILIDSLGPNGEVGHINNIKTYKKDGINYLVVVFADAANIYESIGYLGLYNLSTNEWEYTNVKLTDKSQLFAGPFTEVYNDRVYISWDNTIFCYDILSGEKVWEQQFDGWFFMGGFTIGDSMLVANSEDTYTYGVDPDNGNILWKTKSGGSTSPIAIMNGVAYFSGGSDGRLNAIDITDGKPIWRLYPPGDIDWKRHVAVVPGEGNDPDYIVAATYKEYMAFPAAR